ncbi:MAG: alpha/beta hydrolase [Deltaproteobacteria bacterium]|nr:alpha/beta hydrolase [Deltaproteobacteria bacterium]
MVLNKLKDMDIGFEAGSLTFTEKWPTLVMIHGSGGRSQIWQNQVELLGNSVNTLALDLPGHGDTAGQGKSSVDEYASWLGEILGTLFHEPVFLMGHSLGGAIVQETALSHPNLLKGLILVGTGPVLRVAPMFLEGFLNKFEETIDMVMGYAYASGADLSLVKEGANLMKDAGQEVVHDDFLACNSFDRRKDLGKINLPCLIVCGEEDKLTPPALSETLNKTIKESALTILPSAGHHVMIESHEAFNECVKDFMRLGIRGSRTGRMD